MRKIQIVRSLALAMVLVLALGTCALADDCALCGRETGSDAYLCTACLLGFLNEETPATPLEITTAEQNGDGSVTVRWTDSEGNGPYSVYYELLEAAPTRFGWTAAEDVAAQECTVDSLVPGVSYQFTVVDARGNAAEYTYFAATPGMDQEIGARIRLKPVLRVDGKDQKPGKLSAREIGEDNGSEHGLYVRLNYSMLKRNRHYAFHLAVEAPNGFTDVVYSGTLDLHHGRSYIPVWGFIPVDDYFTLLQNYYGGVPAGEYVVTIYFDGNEVYSDTFAVTE